jgi:hypothetical protein
MTHKYLRTHFSDLFCLFPLILICGCGGSSSPSIPPPPQASEFVYVAAADQSISGFQIGSSGQLSAVPGSPFKVPGSPFNASSSMLLIADPQSRFLLISGPELSGPGRVLVAAGIDESHALTFTSTAKFSNPTVPLMDPHRRFIFVRDNSFEIGVPTLIHVYSVSNDLSFPEVPSSPSQPDTSPQAIDPAGNFIFGFEGGSIDTLQIAATGALTKTASFAVYEPIYGYVHPTGRFFYAKRLNTNIPQGFDLDVFRIDSTGALTLSTTEQNFGNSLVAFHPSGNFVFSLSCGVYPCSLDVLPIDSTTGAISSTPTYSLPQWSGDAALDGTGARLFAASAGKPNDCSGPGKLTVFSVGLHGNLQPIGATAQTGPCPSGVVVTP